MKKPLLTVLMPVYNSEKYLSTAIESILNQRFSDFEFLIIDDGSSDTSAAIVRSYKDTRIRFIQNESNLGISETLNKGIQLASTELMARMDSDDISYPERLQKQYDYFQIHKDCALLSTSAQIITKDGRPIRVDEYYSSYYYYNLNFICWIYHPTVMYKRSCVIDSGLYKEKFSEDFDLWWQMSRKYEIEHLEEVLLDYRLTDESLSIVSKKEEYEKAQHQQVLRNIHYYTGESFTLTFEEIECYRFNFDPIVNNGVKTIMRALYNLKYITDCIIQMPNVNLDIPAVKDAYFYKREYTIQALLNQLSFIKKARLKLALLLNSSKLLF